MSKQEKIARLLSALMNAAGEDMQFVQITPREGQSLEDAIAEHEAKHREECAGCAAAHAVEQAKGIDADKAAMKAHEEAAKAKAAAEAHGAGVKRTPIGYMTFITREGKITPIPGSFNVDRADAEAKLVSFKEFTPLKMLQELSEFAGVPVPAIEVKPVFL